MDEGKGVEGDGAQLSDMQNPDPPQEPAPVAGNSRPAPPGASERAFVAEISHELRTPLTAIMGSLSVIRSGTVGDLPPRMVPLVEMAQRNAERLLALVDDLVDAERIRSGRLDVARRLVDLGDIVRGAIDALQVPAGLAGVTVPLVPAEGPVPVRVDPRRLEQAVINILANAVKFSYRGGRVEVTVDAADGMARVTVADQGPGIPEAHRAHVFDPFWTRDPGDGRNQSGSGLGLGIARALVEAHSGRISFTSRPGDTRFRIEVPLAAGTQGAAR